MDQIRNGGPEKGCVAKSVPQAGEDGCLAQKDAKYIYVSIYLYILFVVYMYVLCINIYFILISYNVHM